MAARVDDVVAEPTKGCPGMLVEFTAITTPPESDVDSWDGLPLGGFDLEANKAKAEFFNRGVHHVEASIGLSSAFVDITVFGLVIVLEPDPADDAYVISADPAMPVIKAHAVGIGAPATAVEWKVQIRYRGDDDCLPMSSGSVQQTEFPQPGLDSITLDWDGKIRGNTVDIVVGADVGGCHFVQSTRQPIKGTNPSRSDIEAALPHKTLRAIACVESNQRQFDASPDGGTARCPLFGPDGAVGVMGLVAPADDTFWDWKANVKSGIDKFKAARDVAKRYPAEVRGSAEFQRQVTRINEIREENLGVGRLTVVLPDFPVDGDFDDKLKLKLLERDTIRGYDGYGGDDGFGGEVHEFRVKMGKFNGEQLPSLIIDEPTLTATAQWEPVPTADRPAGPWDPNYVGRVMALFDGCREVEPPSCQVKILSPGETRSFHPASFHSPTEPGRLSGEETFNAAISGSPPTPHTIDWHVEAIDGWTGSIDFDPPHGLAVTARAKHPNKSRISVNVVHDGEIVCTHETTVSVPQFFSILFSTAFGLDLERLGLRRRAGPSGNLTQSQVDTNEKVRAAVIQEILDSARSAFNPGSVSVLNPTINVRFFALDDPTPSVTAENITVATIGGLDPEHRSFGRTSDGTGAGGTADVGNTDASQTIGIFPGHIMDRTFLDASAITILDKIFGELSEGLDGSHHSGVAVDSGEFVPLTVNPTEPNVVRKRTIQAAIRTFGRFVGSVVVHEAGHALGLSHVGAEPGSPMDDGRTFEKRTGVTSFNPATGELSVHDPARFSGSQQRYLENILKVLN